MATLFSDDFNTGSDGDLASYSTWTQTQGSGGANIQGTTVKEGAKAVSWSAGTNDRVYQKTGTALTAGRITFYVKHASTGTRGVFQFFQGATFITQFEFSMEAPYLTAQHSGILTATDRIDIGEYSTTDWNTCELEWQLTGGTNPQIRGRLNEGTWSDWYDSYVDWSTGIDTFKFDTNNPSGTYYLDTIQENPYVAPSGTSSWRDLYQILAGKSIISNNSII
jgi:hypothetical protein